jgi:hypothetical protein
MTPALTKPCQRCNADKPLEEFYRDRGKPDGRMNVCKACHKPGKLAAYRANPDGPQLQRERYWADPAKPRARRKRNHETLRQAVFDHYGWSCACCGSTEQPSIDHVNGDGGRHRRELGGKSRSPLPVYRWLIKNGFPEGFQTLCLPCNQSKGRSERCRMHFHGTDPEQVAEILRRHGEG